MRLTLYFHLVPRLRMCRHTPPTGMHEEGHLELYTVGRMFLQNKWPVQMAWVRLTPTLTDWVHMWQCYKYLTVILVPQTSKGKKCSKSSQGVRNSFLSTFISVTVPHNCTLSCPLSPLQSWINCGLKAFTSSLQKILFFLVDHTHLSVQWNFYPLFLNRPYKKETITAGKQQLQNSFKGFTFIGTTINE